MSFKEATCDRRVITIGIGTILLALITLEASLLGSGRLLQVGPLTAKMWLFLAAQLYVAFRLITGDRLKLSSVLILSALAVLVSLGAVIGLARQTPLGLIGEDVSPLLYCFMLFFFEMAIRTRAHVRLVVHIVELAAMLMSVAYITVITLMALGVVSFMQVYTFFLTSDQEFLFRDFSGLFFYRGSLYIGVGFIYFAFEKRWWAKLCLVACTAGILATGTRGFVVGLAAAGLAHVMTGILSLRKRMAYGGIVIAATLVVAYLSTMVLVNKAASDQLRITTVNQVMAQVTPLSLIFGNGLGVGVPVRPGHMEIAYVEIFHKQGLLGLMWWTSVFLLLILRYRKARRVDYQSAQPLFLSVIFVIVVSATDSYINNPIGIFVWIVALVGLDVIAREDQPGVLRQQRALPVS
jgi:hypothetical protein